MKGIRFYEEFSNKRKGVSAGNCVAVLLDERGRPLWSDVRMVDAIAAVFDGPNSGVTLTTVDMQWLRNHCKRVPEGRARFVHPNLFALLEEPRRGRRAA